MFRPALKHELTKYAQSPFIFPEEKDFFQRFLHFIDTHPDCLERSNSAHITASAWVINHDRTKALLTHHKKLNLWIQLGGHTEGDANISAVALKEAQEESGIETFSRPIEGIFDIDIFHELPGNCRIHYDIRYILQAPQNATFQVSEESHNLAWVNLAQLDSYTKERTIHRMAEKVNLLE